MSRNLRLAESDVLVCGCGHHYPAHLGKYGCPNCEGIYRGKGGLVRGTPAAAPIAASPAPTRATRSEIEEEMAQQLRLLDLPKYVRQHKPLPNRKFRLDFAWPESMIGLEVDGMVHRIKGRFESDARRHNLLMWLDWHIYRATGSMVRDGSAARMMEIVLLGKATFK